MAEQKINIENPEEEEWTVIDNPTYNDDEGKYEDDPRAGTGSKFYKERSFAQNYLKSPPSYSDYHNQIGLNMNDNLLKIDFSQVKTFIFTRK